MYLDIGDTVFVKPFRGAVFQEVEVVNSNLQRRLWIKWNLSGALDFVEIEEVVKVIKLDGSVWNRVSGIWRPIIDLTSTTEEEVGNEEETDSDVSSLSQPSVEIITISDSD